MTSAQVKTVDPSPGRAKRYQNRQGFAKVGLPSDNKSPRLNSEGLTLKQALFLEAYISNGGNAYQATLKAGYAASSASTESVRLSKHPRILAAMAKRQDVVRAVSAYTIEDHAKALEEQRLLALADKQHTAAAKLLELQGKLRGFYTERLEITHKYEQMTDEELRIKVMALQQDQDGVWHHPLHHIESGHE